MRQQRCDQCVSDAGAPLLRCDEEALELSQPLALHLDASNPDEATSDPSRHEVDVALLELLR